MSHFYFFAYKFVILSLPTDTCWLGLLGKMQMPAKPMSLLESLMTQRRVTGVFKTLCLEVATSVFARLSTQTS